MLFMSGSVFGTVDVGHMTAGGGRAILLQCQVPGHSGAICFEGLRFGLTLSLKQNSLFPWILHIHDLEGPLRARQRPKIYHFAICSHFSDLSRLDFCIAAVCRHFVVSFHALVRHTIRSRSFRRQWQWRWSRHSPIRWCISCKRWRWPCHCHAICFRQLRRSIGGIVDD